MGQPIEKSCQLEGTLDMIELRKKQLQRQLEEVERVSESLKSSIEEVQNEEPTHPVITTLPILTPAVSLEHVPESGGTSPCTPNKANEEEQVHSAPHSPSIVASDGTDGVEVTEHTPGAIVRHPHSPGLIGSPCTIDNSDITSHYNRLVSSGANLMSMYEPTENDHPDSVEFGCASFFGKRYASDEEECGMGRLIGLSFDSEGSENMAENHIHRSTLSSTPSRGVASRSFSSAPPASASFDTVDFRTGMSGHRALLSTRTSDRRTMPSKREVLRMSQHMGISKLRGSNR